MRSLLIVALLAGAAQADGVYIVGDFGGSSLRGERLDGRGTFRMRGGVGGVLGLWAIEVWGAADVDPGNFAVDCTEPCAAFAPLVSFETGGVDVRRELPLVYAHPPRNLRFFRPRLSAFVHGGVRYVHGDDSLVGYQGGGIGGGVGFELNVRVFAAYVDFGLDRFELEGPHDSIDGESFHIVLGERIGFSL